MTKLTTTKLSSRGQVVIPEAIRQRMNLQKGDQFVILSEADVIILKRIAQSDSSNVEKLLSTTRQAATEYLRKVANVEQAIEEV